MEGKEQHESGSSAGVCVCACASVRALLGLRCGTSRMTS